MKLLAYKNPFELQSLSFWNELKKYPHLCVSQTLVEGLKAYYGRESFSLLCTIDLFLKQFYSEWHGDNELKLFQSIHLSNAIKKIKNKKLQSSFKHNQYDILKSIRFIIECGIRPEDIQNKNYLSEEQICLIEIYEELYEIDCFKSLFYQSEREFDGLLTCAKEIMIKEMERNLDLQPKLSASIDDRIQEIKTAINSTKKMNKTDEDDSLKHVINLLENLGSEQGDFTFDKVVIHGVHQFTPLIYKFINRLNELGVEVIFLFNYCEEFSSIYNTWDKVYRWTKRDIEHHGTLFNIIPRQLGENMGSIFEGRVKEIQKTDEFLYRFDNLTSFTDYVSPIYEDAKEKAKQSSLIKKIDVIKNMSEQFYAVDGSEINSLLKVYFPEHFGDRHFLSYPIGQFILGIYNMWDSKNKQIKIDERNLKECLSLNIWKFRDGLTPLQIFYDMSLYFKGAHTFTEYMTRLDKIKKTVSSSTRDRTKRLSFFSYTKDDVESFIKVIEYINNFATQLFKNGQDDLRSHYKELIEYIETNMNSAEISKKEQSFIEEIKNRLETIEIEDIVADIEDIRNTLHFYLTASENKDQEAEWIVRDFEQIDGGVLLAKAKDEKRRGNRNASYHFAGLSDENLLSKTKKSLPFPITIDMIDGMNEISTLVALCKKEYIHFLRFSLFYGTYFLSALNPISLSYIEEMEGKKAEPYSIFKILNLPEQDWQQVDTFDNTEPMLPYNDRSTIPLDHNLDDSMKRSANACYLRFLFNHCLDPYPFFNDEFNLFYVSQLLATYTIIDKNRVENIPMLDTLTRFKNLFPFMSSLDIKQIEKMVLRDYKSPLEPKYVDTKLEFKYYSWKTESGDNLFRNITFVPRENTNPYKNFTKNLDRFINDDNLSFLPDGHNWKMCDVCNQKYVCGYGLKVKESI
ncbi:hypothetical protein P4654_27100 [Niallia taxi]|uniref:hypothetical protein n=1 Tax=Niallia taxi TaxID=2499688 RepID=UPI002E25100F|nr:hypothetical protein [Niallia taxi]MED4122320.1 hypothetical protein [Niallia taxi]